MNQIHADFPYNGYPYMYDMKGQLILKMLDLDQTQMQTQIDSQNWTPAACLLYIKTKNAVHKKNGNS